jgi:hypothetical protein
MQGAGWKSQNGCHPKGQDRRGRLRQTSPAVKAGFAPHAQGRELKLIVFEIPLSIWQGLQQQIRSRFPQAAFQFSGGLSTVYVTIPGTPEFGKPD